MAIRMQQRRGTAAQWTAADPVLAAGEIGFETDTGKFKIGNGSSVWTALSYFTDSQDFDTANFVLIGEKGAANGVATLDATGNIPVSQLGKVIATAPALLDTLAELASAINSDPNFSVTVENAIETAVNNAASALNIHGNDTTNVHGIADTSVLVTQSDIANRPSETWVLDAISTHSAVTQNVHGIADTTVLATTTELTTHTTKTTNVHGIADTSELATTSSVNSAITTAVSDHNNDTTAVHGIPDTTVLSTISYVDDEIVLALTSHNDDTTNVHGIADTTALATQQDITNHNILTQNVHGIADTALLATTAGVTSEITSAISDHNGDYTNVHGIPDTSVLETVTGSQDKADAAEAAAVISATAVSNQYTDGEIITHNLSTTNVHGIADTAALALTADVDAALLLKQDKVSGVSDTEIGYLDGVTSGIQAQIDSKAPVTSPTLSEAVLNDGVTINAGIANAANINGDVVVDGNLTVEGNIKPGDLTGIITLGGDTTISGNLTVSGTTTTVSAQDLIVSDPLIYIGEGNTANLVDLGLVGSFDNGTYQHAGIARDASDNKWKIFKGVTDEPTTTINFAQGSLDNLAVNNIEVAGVVFTDGTQTKEGVPSRTSIVQKTDSYTLGALSERDSMIEVNKATAVTVTVPTDATVNFPVGTSIDILQTGAGQVSIVGASGVTVNCTPSGGTNTAKLRTQWSSATLFKRAANTWVVMGDLSA